MACKISSVFVTEFSLCSPTKVAPAHRKSATPLRFVTLFLCNFIVLYLFVRFFSHQLLTKSQKFIYFTPIYFIVTSIILHLSHFVNPKNKVFILFFTFFLKFMSNRLSSYSFPLLVCDLSCIKMHIGSLISNQIESKRVSC